MIKHLYKIIIVSFCTLLILLYQFYTNIDKPSSSKKVLFLVTNETAGGGGKGVETLYQEMKKDGHNVKIVAIPRFVGEKLYWDIDNKLLQQFNEQDVIYPCGKEEPYTKCEDLSKYQPDFIFTQNPYNYDGGVKFMSSFGLLELKNTKAKIVYIPYGPHIFHQDVINDEKLKNFVDIVFVDSESTKKLFINNFKFSSKKVVVSGYQPYKELRDRLKHRNIDVKNENGDERATDLGDLSNSSTTLFKVNNYVTPTILWLPRWTLSTYCRAANDSGSTFLSYHYFFYNYAIEHPKINFIIRPHVSLFKTALEEKYINQNQINEIINNFNSLPNIKMSSHLKDSLTNDILESDIIIADGTSALAEVVVADKPIIYLSNGIDNEFESNDLGKQLKNFVYLAHSPIEIINYLELIKNNNYLVYPYSNIPLSFSFTDRVINKIKKIWKKDAPNLNTRDYFKQQLDPIENPAKYISNYISKN